MISKKKHKTTNVKYVLYGDVPYAKAYHYGLYTLKASDIIIRGDYINDYINTVPSFITDKNTNKQYIYTTVNTTINPENPDTVQIWTNATTTNHDKQKK